MATVAIIGTGFVADLYMRSLATFPWIRVVRAYDIDTARLAAFCSYWNVSPADSLNEALGGGGEGIDLVLNLTNPASHFEVSKLCLQAGKHVYSEKPLATEMSHAAALCALAKEKGLMLASAPCSLLGESAQAAWLAVRRDMIGKPYLAYAELDDGFIAQAPYDKWTSESGAPWPWRDEFATGCTLEHAGYYLTWLMAMFGPVRTVVAASAGLAIDKLGPGSFAPDFSVAVLYFERGSVARLTCSVIAPHDHRLRIFGEDGVLEVNDCWDSRSPVRIRRRHTIRRRLVDSPFTRRVKIPGPTHPQVGRRGAASMNFALGPAEMLSALEEGRSCRLSPDFALHLNEVTLAIQNSHATSGAQTMTTAFSPIEPMPWARDRQ